MAYIYKITNQVNGKIYIGKTYETIERRFSQHKNDAKREELQNRPLYSAMRKYGAENFTIEEIEKTDNPEDRERYWIEYFSSFKNGYNATIGGDGRPYIDYDLVVATYKELKIKQLVADKLNIHVSTVSKILKERNIDNIYTNKEAMQVIKGKIVNQYTLDGEFIRSFPSYSEAARSLGKITSTSKGASAHISEACRGKRKTAYGFIWKSE